ncbi:MAG: transcription termination factor NusA, partial [bacterium]
IIVGAIQRVEGRRILIDLGKVAGIMPSDQQVPNEFYRPGSKMKFYVVAVNMSVRGPEIVLSRNNASLVREIFRQEIPEISEGLIEIKGVARDAGFRSKVAVFTADESIDPIGSCIGQRGSRINTIVEELGGEKVDIIQYSDDAAAYVAKALSPAKVLDVVLNEGAKTTDVTVASDQFSLAIGRSGQNVRLASELTGWKINVKDQGGTAEEEVEEEQTPAELVEEDKTGDENVSVEAPEEKTEDKMEEKKEEEEAKKE